MPSLRNTTLRCERWRSEGWFWMLSRFERHQAVSHDAAEVPSKTMCRQTLATPDGPERHRRFYLAVARSAVVGGSSTCSSPFLRAP